MTQKTILVHYLNVGTKSLQERHVMLKSYRDKVLIPMAESSNGGDILSLVLPIENGESRIECINPVQVSEQEYASVLEKVIDINKKFDEFLKSQSHGEDAGKG